MIPTAKNITKSNGKLFIDSINQHSYSLSRFTKHNQGLCPVTCSYGFRALECSFEIDKFYVIVKISKFQTFLHVFYMNDV